MAPPPRCLYETLGVSRTATDDEIKKAYRREALAHHPDKNPDNLAAAEEAFKHVQHAYTVLSDSHERAWYDDHRADILRGREPGAGGGGPNGEKPGPAAATDVDIFSLFSAAAFSGFDDGPAGFFAVYAAAFAQLWAEERDADGASRRAPSFGAADADWAVARHFYREWDAFASVKTFAFADKWHLGEAPNRDHRRAMERENRKERARVRKEFNASVRELVAFVKKRDPRVAKRRLHEAREKEKAERDATERRERLARERKDDLERTRAARDEALEEDAAELDQILANIALDEKLERKQRRRGRRKAEVVEDTEEESSDEHGANTTVADDDDDEALDELDTETAAGLGDLTDEEEEDEEEEEEEFNEEELYCVACRKMFRTVAQRVDHERSKKHKQALAKLQREVLKKERELGGAEIANETLDAAAEGMGNGEAEAEATRTASSKKRKKKRGNKAFPSAILEEDAGAGEGETKEEQTNGHDGVANGEAQPPDAGTADGETNGGAVETEEKVLSKREKRKLREKRKKEGGDNAEKAAGHHCNRCGANFPSRTKLMRHVNEKGHALHV